MLRAAVSRTWRLVASVSLGAGVLSASEIPETVSPGGADRLTLVPDICPTFSWSAVPGVDQWELVAIGLAPEQDLAASFEPQGSSAELRVLIPGGATSWTPASHQCLQAAGDYVWVVRGVRGNEEVPRTTEWSRGRYFRVREEPSLEEVDRALAVLERFAAARSADLALASRSPMKQSPEMPSRGGELRASRLEKEEGARVGAAGSAITAPAGLRAVTTDEEGYGVVGVSSGGAGIAAIGAGGAADLLLDGQQDAVTDTRIRESELDRASADDQAFTFRNSGDGVLNLIVDGTLFGDGSGLDNVDAATLLGNAPADFASSDQACGAGSYVSAVAANGDLVCSPVSDYLNQNCYVYFGWRDACDGCTSAPTKWGRVAGSDCTLGIGADSSCQLSTLDSVSVNLLGLNTDGEVAGDDKFYVGFRCFAPASE